MSNVRINALTATAVTPNFDDYFVIDGNTYGTRNILATTALSSVTGLGSVSVNSITFPNNSVQSTAYPASVITPLTGNWNQAYSYTNSISATQASNFTNIAVTSANWNVAFSDTQVIAPISGNWNQAYTTYNANSASYATGSFVYNNFLPLSGGTVTGNLNVNNNLVVYGTLSALSASYFQTSIFTSSSALSVISVGGGPALFVQELGTTGDIASFYDTYGEVLHVGNRSGTPYNGLVGINNGAPNKALTVVGDISSTAVLYGSALEVGLYAPTSVLPNLVSQFTTKNNTYQQVNITNLFPGSAASSDYVATADNGSDTLNFVDLGINNSLYNDPAFNIAQANDAYLYNNGGNFAIGTSTSNALKFFTNGTLSSNIAMYIAPGGNVGVGPAVVNPGATLTVNGMLSTNNIINDANGTSTQWNQAYTYTNANSSLIILSGSNAYLNSLTASTANFLNGAYFQDANAFILRDNSLDLTIVGPYQISLKPNGVYQWTFANDGGLAAPDGMVFAGSTGGVQFVDGTVQQTAYPAATITPLTGNWNQAYTYFTWLTANSGNNTGGTAWQANSALVLGDLTNIASTSANWNQSYTYTNSNSSLFVLSGSNAYLNTLTATNVNILNYESINAAPVINQTLTVGGSATFYGGISASNIVVNGKSLTSGTQALVAGYSIVFGR